MVISCFSGTECVFASCYPLVCATTVRAFAIGESLRRKWTPATRVCNPGKVLSQLSQDTLFSFAVLEQYFAVPP